MAADEHTVAFLDARPVFKGHVLVIPRLHYLTLANLPPELTGQLFARVQQISAAMATASGTDGSFIGVDNTVTQSVPTCTSMSYPARTEMACSGPQRCWPTPAGTCSGPTPGTPIRPSRPATPVGSVRHFPALTHQASRSPERAADPSVERRGECLPGWPVRGVYRAGRERLQGGLAGGGTVPMIAPGSL